jgi:hypothetical protein
MTKKALKFKKALGDKKLVVTNDVDSIHADSLDVVETDETFFSKDCLYDIRINSISRKTGNKIVTFLLDNNIVFDSSRVKEAEHDNLEGKAEISNGQTLCAQHNFQKKYYKQTETGKRMFIRLYELAKANNDKELIKFCEDVLQVYEKNNINGHIVWKK